MAIAASPADTAPQPTVGPPVDAGPLESEQGHGWTVAMLFAFALVIGAYFTFRFGGLWSEWDTAAQAESIRTIVKEQTLLSSSGNVYANGYAFGAVSAFLIDFTGVEIATLIQLIYPLISASLVIIAWPLYRELTGSARGATLATTLLFAQPEFLFVVLRGSHERVLRALLLASLLLLVRSLKSANDVRLHPVYVGLFYAAVYGVIATNSLFGSSYVWALSIALIGSWSAGYLGPALAAVSISTRRRLIYVPIFCALLAFMFNTYIYPPAGATVSQIPSLIDQLSRIFLTTSPNTADVPYNAYQTVVESWTDTRVYFLVSAGTYLIIISSAIVWVRIGLRWLARAEGAPTMGQWLLWLFYLAFAMQGALSIVADRAGSLGGNLQYRSFPSFAMMAAPMTAVALARWTPGPRARRLGALGLGLLAVLAIVKATNEPTVSNKWTFYQPSEVAGLLFVNSHLKDIAFWADFDERLRAVEMLTMPSSIPMNIDIISSTRVFMVSDIVRIRASRLGTTVPAVAGELRVYDNGGAQIYRLRSRTPFQS